MEVTRETAWHNPYLEDILRLSSQHHHSTRESPARSCAQLSQYSLETGPEGSCFCDIRGVLRGRTACIHGPTTSRSPSDASQAGTKDKNHEFAEFTGYKRRASRPGCTSRGEQPSRTIKQSYRSDPAAKARGPSSRNEASNFKSKFYPGAGIYFTSSDPSQRRRKYFARKRPWRPLCFSRRSCPSRRPLLY
jgi:hypothetical protein